MSSTAPSCHRRAGATVDDFLRAGNPRVYAAGDICTPYKFTHAADALSRTIHTYPSVGEVAKKLGDAWMRRKLTPRVKGVLSTVLAWRR